MWSSNEPGNYYACGLFREVLLANTSKHSISESSGILHSSGYYIFENFDFFPVPPLIKISRCEGFWRQTQLLILSFFSFFFITVNSLITFSVVFKKENLTYSCLEQWDPAIFAYHVCFFFFLNRHHTIVSHKDNHLFIFTCAKFHWCCSKQILFAHL